MAALTLLVTSAGLQLLGSDGTLTTLTLPTGVTTVAGVASRVAMLANHLVVTGGVSQAIWIRPNLTYSVLTLPKPGNKPALSSGGAGSYTGARRAKVQFLIKDAATKSVLGYGPLSEPSDSFSFSAQKQTIGSIATSLHPSVNCRRIFLTAASGTDYFAAVDIDDNTTTSITVDISDASLDLTAIDATQFIGAPTDLDLITPWKDRLWGRSGLDNLVGSVSGGVYSWPVLFPIDPRGTDNTGLSGLIPRRDQLGVCRRHIVWALTGSSESNYQMIKVAEGIGCVAPGSCIVVRDVGYFLGDDGIYAWDDQGIHSITDDTVKPWFTTDTYFNRAGMQYCFAAYDPVRNRILFFLPVAGGTSTVLNRWVELDIDSGKWFGPHVCSAVTSFSGATTAPDATNKLRLILGGSDGVCYAFAPGTFTDGSSTAISLDAKGKPHAGDSPDLTHVFLQPTIFTKQQSGGTLTVTPHIGGIGASAGTAQSHDMTKERERLARLGVGNLCALEFTEATAAQAVEIYGYLIPYATLGRR